jgi:ribosome-binding protein aMBF1 (putative translation factor)
VKWDTRIGFSLSIDKSKDLRDPGRWLGYGGPMPSTRSTAIVHALLARIVVARKSMGMSQESLAELSGVDLGVISRAERLQRIPGMASILDMALALELDVPALVKSAIRDAEREENPKN